MKKKRGGGTTKRKSTSTMKRKATRKRILPVAKRGGVLPLLPLLGGLGALGSLIGGAASVAKTVNENAFKKRQLEELQRHNRALEGRGMYLLPYKRGSGHASRRRKKKIRNRHRR